MNAGTPILTAAQMRSAEQALFGAGVDDYGLMEEAGAAAAAIIWRAGGLRDTLVLCGPGNNGGDGFVIARLLRARGVAVRVAVLGESGTPSSRRAQAGWDGPVEQLATAAPATQLVDALFGTGLSRGLDPAVAARLCDLSASASHSYAIDLPSGVDSDSGALLSAVPHFSICIALGALKPAHLIYPAAGHVRRLICADIGIPASDLVHRLMPPRLAAPGPDDHKYRRGLVTVVGGTMAGASILAAQAAARSGAGMVRRLAADGLRHGADAIVTQDAQTVDALHDWLDDARLVAVLVGPGLGRDATARARLEAVLTHGHPLVLDADALTLIDVDQIPDGAILTPHEGEFARLFGDLPGSKIDRARAAAERSGAIVIYKGADSVIAAPDGRVAVASGSSHWLSTAGTGDVLAGLVAGRLAVTRDAFRAAGEAVWLHGDAARRVGAAFIADDLLAALPAAIAARL
ncbi:MAG: bifunctional ADP-dependent NAD(P)H-hydrate dehydratase/NAD(P)H-hydrate epimerase [Pseudomonadota bacterium]|uniref:Bifunctional NAD(P)H-hydrate repair enzyme n=1 Tax=Sphingobium xenophagum TaxID=121428 RepID=A0A249MVA6_SPHXE|nr:MULTISPECIES: bifunctional ADP-dependent NAD(P)H-hydrate dehydratase/NAD(P)H-hydrate epimerase [Sphingobium]ASY45222.1 bifunctional ADP-dependent NAD(P)H-hydrate dehydratase/NAD(P)H-hydrate epimerase [Sphingobium xenophagum]OUC54634.1 bifunctional ADP-dependent NAD(P)H-hydrate dehydratase/NAD(P)H-hydrate epimerase [Sphingobium sp. GW456-12-10-14-TSB1]QWT14164.1 bifunctional ADP-dependent NAD(P)H-hydrate dehydratase/NAD(P)H-hydrate epimerase [Sphingobium xenophagum]